MVGGGLGGLAAARRLLGSGLKVLLLEAQERVGGRTKAVGLASAPSCSVDLGGQWIGPLHTRMLALWEELGLPLVPQYAKGADLLDDGRSVRRSLNAGTNIPRVGLHALLELQLRVLRPLIAKARALPPLEALRDAGRRGREACQLARLDATTVEAWLRRRCCFAASRRLGALCVEMVLGCQPSQVSMLAFLQYIRANGGLTFLTEVRGGAQDWWAGGGGAGRAAPLLLARLRAEHAATFEARLGCAVAQVVAEPEAGGGGVTVHTARGEAFRAAQAVLALPPTAALERVALSPEPPVAWRHMAQRSFMGCYTKAVAVYDAPFWRERGLSGTAMRLAWDEEHPVANVYDHSEWERPAAEVRAGAEAGGVEVGGVEVGGVGGGEAGPRWVAARGAAAPTAGPAAALVCFLAGDAAMLYAEAGEERLREAVLRSLVRFFGEEARGRLVELVACDWSRDAWARGCPVNLLAPGHFAYVHAMREPLLGGRLHWGSTEASPEFTGYMEGAVRAGEAAAEAILARRRPDAASPGETEGEAPPRSGWAWCGSGARD